MTKKELLKVIERAAREKAEKLDLSGRGLTEIPREIGQLKNLTDLNLGRNQLTFLPPEIGRLTNLTGLFFNLNKLVSVPSEIGQLTNLTRLSFSDNQLTSLPPEIGQLTNLTKLFFNLNHLSSIPSGIGKMTNLTRLSFSDNQLTSLPPEIGQLKNLTELWLYNNHLMSLPREIGQLTSLIRIELQENHVRSLPQEIGQLVNLNILYLDRNRLTSLPAEIGQLTNLTKLAINENNLRLLPPEIGQLKNLTMISLNSNKLISVPPEIGQLTNLTNLKLYSNQLKTIPPEIGQLEKLEDFGVYDNQLERPPQEIAEKGIQAIRDWFESVAVEEGELPLNEVKVLLVGEGGSGKTSLVKQLFGEEFDPHEKQTHGIRIRKWQVPRKKDKITVKFWDFGGQEIMYSTHQFFLSKRSLYIVVLDGRKDEDPEYWLKMIESFGGDSPIMVILNKIDTNPGFDVDRFHLENKYDGIEGFYRLSCETGEGIEKFQQALKKALTSVEIIKTTWGKTWFDVKTKLENMTNNFISYEEYSDMCKDAGVTEESQQNTLVEFLHDLGDVVHFGDFELHDTYVLEPTWLTTAVYRIINAKVLAEKDGVLQLTSLQNILRKKDAGDLFYCPRDRHPYIIKLMKKFELCYGIDNDTILVPDLLPNKQLVFFPIDEALRVVIDFDYLPRSVIPRFIVKMHRDIKGNQQWRTGVVLYDKNFKATAMVKADVDERRIYIYIYGDQRRDYLAVIMFQFNEIISSFEKINAVREVPLPGEPDVRVDLKHLMTLEKLGERDFIPVGSEKRYKVRELLGIVYVEDRSKEEMIQLLRKLVKEDETKDSFKKRIADVFSVQVGAGLGVGISLGKLYELIEEMFKGKN